MYTPYSISEDVLNEMKSLEECIGHSYIPDGEGKFMTPLRKGLMNPSCSIPVYVFLGAGIVVVDKMVRRQKESRRHFIIDFLSICGFMVVAGGVNGSFIPYTMNERLKEMEQNAEFLDQLVIKYNLKKS